MNEIIPSIERGLLQEELTHDRLVCRCERSGNEVYSVCFENAPNVCREVGRLREITFRTAGGGTGKALDLDEFDVMKNPYNQLIVWNPKERSILGGYRYKLGNEMDFNEEGIPKVAMSHLFRFSKNFLQNYLPYSIELGRAFVFNTYQATRKERESLWTLFDIWKGLSFVIDKHSSVKYTFGKVTLYPDYPAKGRDLLLTYMNFYFGDKEDLLSPISPYRYKDRKDLFEGKNLREGYMLLTQELRKINCAIPPMLNTYIKTSPKLKCFGTALNEEFGNVFELGILIEVQEMSEKRKKFYLGS